MTSTNLYSTTLRLWQKFPLSFPVAILVDAPHGRYSPDLTKSAIWQRFVVDGTLAWIGMEIPSILSLLYAYARSASPFSFNDNPTASFLVLLFLIHYLNRAIISPLRTPNRARVNIAVPLFGVAFNLVNGYLIGSWLGSGILPPTAWKTSATPFWASVALWAVGFCGNVWHDEVLLRIRRRKIEMEKRGGKEDKKPYYAIPYGGLYRFISFPNYFCEWLEWTGFALASSIASGWATPFYDSPPWLFLINEAVFMFPRAVSGHKWYRSKFQNYPKERKAVIPFLL